MIYNCCKKPLGERANEMEMKQERVGQVIRDTRRAQNMRSYKLADDVGMTAPAMSMLENGKSVPQPDKLEAIAKILGLDPDMLKKMGESEAEQIEFRKGSDQDFKQIIALVNRFPEFSSAAKTHIIDELQVWRRDFERSDGREK